MAASELFINRKLHPFLSSWPVCTRAVQSSWFPLTDRNPQKFMEIPRALTTDFTRATQRVYRGGATGSRLTLRILPGPM